MGCDIHCYIEQEKDGWAMSIGEIFPGRDYDMFELLAGVRCYNENSAVFPPRGIPKKLGWQADEAFHIHVLDDDISENDKKLISQWSENYCTPESAKRWVAEGCSKYANEQKNMITHPDWHTPSFLYTHELDQIIKTYKQKHNKRNPLHYIGILKMMKELDKASTGAKARLTFWFDN